MKKFKLAAVPLLLAIPFAAQANVTIDLFSTDQAKLIDTTTGDGGLQSSVSSAGGDILGGERDLFVELLTQSSFNPTAVASIGVAGGALSFSVESLATATGTVQWDGGDGDIALDPTGLGGVDLSGLVNFEVTTIFSDLGYEFLINAFSSATQWTSISFSAHAVNSPTTSYIPLAAFDTLALCGSVNPAPGVNSITCGSGNTAPVDWSNLGALELQIDPNGGTVSVDLTLDAVRAVPAPGALALLGAGLIGFGATRRRKA